MVMMMMSNRWWMRRVWWLGVVMALTACSQETNSFFSATGQKRASGWYFERASDQTVNITWVDKQGQAQSWEGLLFDDSLKGTPLKPLQEGEDHGLFRWKRPGCATVSFVLSSNAELKCTTCMEPSEMVEHIGTCPLDQQRLPVQGWRVKGLLRPQKAG